MTTILGPKSNEIRPRTLPHCAATYALKRSQKSVADATLLPRLFIHARVYNVRSTLGTKSIGPPVALY